MSSSVFTKIAEFIHTQKIEYTVLSYVQNILSLTLQTSTQTSTHSLRLIVPHDWILDFATVLASGRLVQASGPRHPFRRLVVRHFGLGSIAGGHTSSLGLHAVHVQRSAAQLCFLYTCKKKIQFLKSLLLGSV